MASWVNSLGVTYKGTLLSNPPPVLCCALSLFFTLAGSIAYCMGTLGYFPEVKCRSSGGESADVQSWMSRVIYLDVSLSAEHNRVIYIACSLLVEHNYTRDKT